MVRVNLDYTNYMPQVMFASTASGVVVPLVVIWLFRRSATHRGKAVKIASEMLAASVCPCCEATLGDGSLGVMVSGSARHVMQRGCRMGKWSLDEGNLAGM